MHISTPTGKLTTSIVNGITKPKNITNFKQTIGRHVLSSYLKTEYKD
jgi:hypothetical protein